VADGRDPDPAPTASTEASWLAGRPPTRLELGATALRRWHADDAQVLLAAVLDSMDRLRPWMPWADGYDAAAAAGFLDGAMDAWEARTEFLYALVDRDDAVLGSFGLHTRRGRGRLEVGYWLREEATGRGLATLAAAAVTDAAFGLAGVEEVEIHVDRANERSRGVPERLGFRLREQQPLPVTAPGEDGVTLVWSLDRTEFDASEVPRVLQAAQRGASAS
jgi:RimJ/RimL family protein N-acetyltransferase